jgi:hypothetical protein
VLDRAPQPLDIDVVAPTAAPVHADLDAALGERAHEVQARELAGPQRADVAASDIEAFSEQQIAQHAGAALGR